MTIFGITLTPAILWFIIAGAFALIEGITLGLITIWFSGGAVGAAVAAMLGASTIVQIIVFLVISIALIAITRPLARKRLNSQTEKTNVDAIIGTDGIVEETVSQYKTGQVRADGKVWTATCESGEIKKGAIVVIKSIKGVTLMVEEKEQEEK